MQSGNEIWPVYVILQKKKFYQKIVRKMWPGNQFQALFNFHRILRKRFCGGQYFDLDKF